ncbi:MAG: DUF3362 domain-containing protein, partial [Gammaproteobacteria bacterium]|nr:DUF3362 domain-containing protein [Gammaproteobacteria bacterium]
RYHAPENWPLLREALKKMGRTDLIGNGKRHLVPAWQPKSTDKNNTQKKKSYFANHKTAIKPSTRQDKKNQTRHKKKSNRH